MTRYALALALLLAPALARGEGDVDPEVQKHFGLGNSAYGEGRYADALIEYDEAYKRSKNWKILFNRGQCLVMLKREPEAIEVFEQYLKEGGEQIPEERREQVTKDIAHLKDRIAFVTVDAKGEGWEVLIDGRPAGVTPLKAPLRVGMGVHELSVRRPQSTGPGYTKRLELVGGAKVTEVVDLPPEPPKGEAPKKVPEGLPSPAFNFALQLGISTPTTLISKGRLAALGAIEGAVSYRAHPLFEIGAFLGGAGGRYALNEGDAVGARVETQGDYTYALFGVRARLHVLRDRYFDGWIGVDAGAWRESWKFDGRDGDAARSFQYIAFSPLVGGSGGIDFPLSDNIAVGGTARLIVSSAEKGTRVDCGASADCNGDLPGSNGFARAFFDFGARLVWILPYGGNR